jgi:chorismate mutase/prephenate dehydratase
MKNGRRVAFQGEEGAYSEEAVYKFFGDAVEAVPCKSLSDVFRVVEERRVDWGLVPVENSLGGSIVRTYDLFLDSTLRIRGETILKVVHCLISDAQTDLHAVKTVYSHPQALAQCRAFLEQYKLESMATYDTAGSVKMLKDKKFTESAAIASEHAAHVYGMTILAKGIQTNPNNFTRFFIIGETDAAPTGDDKTSLVFSTKHAPGALFNALKQFATRTINLTKIESRPIINRPWEYNFYLDLEGHREDPNIQEALQALREHSTFVKILGSYPRAKEYVVRNQ